MSSASTKSKLISLIDDIDIITRELLELYNAAHQRGEATSTEDLLDLLLIKDKELKDTMQIARNQQKAEQEIHLLEMEIAKRDQDLLDFQVSLNDAEYLLQSSIYNARAKLESIEASKKTRVTADEIVRYSHKISSSDGVCSPANWVPGNPRRPYPSDMDMRQGHLGRLNDLTLPDSATHGANALNPANGPQNPLNPHIENMGLGMPQGVNGQQMVWKAGDNSTNDHGSAPKPEDVELMSSESSSSSSSDE